LPDLAIDALQLPVDTSQSTPRSVFVNGGDQTRKLALSGMGQAIEVSNGSDTFQEQYPSPFENLNRLSIPEGRQLSGLVTAITKTDGAVLWLGVNRQFAARQSQIGQVFPLKDVDNSGRLFNHF